MSAFADLHRPGTPLLLPNAWDHASAAALAAAGFEAIGTTSLGVAAALGPARRGGGDRRGDVELAHRLTHLPVPSPSTSRTASPRTPPRWPTTWRSWALWRA